MGSKKETFLGCIGTVTIVTDELLVLQGQIVDGHNDRGHDEDECCNHENRADFIRLRLACDPALIREDATIEEIEPDLFQEGDIIRINVNKILTVGPSRACLGDDKCSE